MKKKTEDIFEPAIPVVPEGWDVLPFEQAVDVISDKSKRVKQSAYLPSGKLPVIDQGQEFIGGYTDDEDMAFEGELPVILFGDHTRSIKYVDKPFAVGAEGVKILKPSNGFEPKYLYYLLRSLLMLTPFCGHPNLMEQGVHHAQISPPLSGGIPPTDH